MVSTSGQTMYENGSLVQATGELLHPGGVAMTERMLSLCDLPTNARLLDLGYGTDSTVEHLLEKGYQAVGVDRSEMLLKTRKDQCPDLPLACGWGKSLSVASGQMDVVLSECSLSAMSDLEAVLKECWRVLRPGGWLAVSDVYARNPEGLPALRALPLRYGLSDARSQYELTEQIQVHGFEILAWEDHSDELKYLAAQMIQSHGSMGDFRSRSEPVADPLDIQIAIGKTKLGYYLLVARRYL